MAIWRGICMPYFQKLQNSHSKIWEKIKKISRIKKGTIKPEKIMLKIMFRNL
jgi:hypothetical protein